MRRNFLLGVCVCAAAALSALGIACGEAGNSAAPRSDAGGNSAVDTGAPSNDAGAIEEDTVGDQCGQGPWVNVGLDTLAISLSSPDGLPLSGVAFTSPLCPGVVRYSDDAGQVLGAISRDVPFYGRLQKTNYLPELTPEESFDAGQTGISFDMLPTLFGTVLQPPFSASASTILVSANSTVADAGSCSELDGVVFAVTGHPEAQVAYYAAGAIPTAIDGGTATSSRGLATISGLAPSQLVTVTATKPGCQVALASGASTGRVPVEAGFLSVIVAHVSP
jgi:hypothetical protein